MRFNVVTFGSAFVDVYLSSSEFKIVKSKDSPTGVAICQVYGAKIKVKKMVMTTGGGATNVAVGLERLGLQTGCVCMVGSDDWGLFVRKELRKEGVSPLYIQETDEAPTSYSTMLVSEEGGRTALVYRGASSQLNWRQVAWDKLDGDWFYITSLGGDFNLLTKIIRTAQDKKIKIAFNPGGNEIEAKERLKSFLPHVDLLILNKLEARELTKAPAGLAAKMVVVTAGAKGATLFKGKEKIELPAYKVKMVEETGAGDAFGAGLLAGLIKGMGLKQALKLGMANGASVTTRFGPKAGLLFAPEANTWLKK